MADKDAREPRGCPTPGACSAVAQIHALTERNLKLREALRDGLNLQSRWSLDKKIYPDEAAWIAKVRRLIEEKP